MLNYPERSINDPKDSLFEIEFFFSSCLFLAPFFFWFALLHTKEPNVFLVVLVNGLESCPSSLPES